MQQQKNGKLHIVSGLQYFVLLSLESYNEYGLSRDGDLISAIMKDYWIRLQWRMNQSNVNRRQPLQLQVVCVLCFGDIQLCFTFYRFAEEKVLQGLVVKVETQHMDYIKFLAMERLRLDAMMMLQCKRQLRMHNKLCASNNEYQIY